MTSQWLADDDDNDDDFLPVQAVSTALTPYTPVGMDEVFDDDLEDEPQDLLVRRPATPTTVIDKSSTWARKRVSLIAVAGLVIGLASCLGTSGTSSSTVSPHAGLAQAVAQSYLTSGELPLTVEGLITSTSSSTTSSACVSPVTGEALSVLGDPVVLSDSAASTESYSVLASTPLGLRTVAVTFTTSAKTKALGLAGCPTITATQIASADSSSAGISILPPGLKAQTLTDAQLSTLDATLSPFVAAYTKDDRVALRVALDGSDGTEGVGLGLPDAVTGHRVLAASTSGIAVVEITHGTSTSLVSVSISGLTGSSPKITGFLSGVGRIPVKGSGLHTIAAKADAATSTTAAGATTTTVVPVVTTAPVATVPVVPVVTTAAPVTVPVPVVASVTATATGSTTASIVWDTASGGSYSAEMWAGDPDTGTLVSSATSSPWDAQGLTPATFYTVRVTSVTAGGTSAPVSATFTTSID